MKKKLLAILLISVLTLSCITTNIWAADRPVVSVDNILSPASQNTTDLIFVPIRTTGFIGKVTTIGIDVTFDNTKLVYDKTCGLGNIPVLDGTIPTTTWVKHNAFAEANANTSGKITFICDNPLTNPYVSENVIPGIQDILYNITFKRLGGATGKAAIGITVITYDTDGFVTYSSKNGDIDVVNGGITFEEPPVPTPEPTVAPTPRPTITPKPTATPRPTVSPKPTVSPRPTVSPKPTATPRPTVSPKPTVSPRPTVSPKPTCTPRPTVTPKPTVSPRPTATPKPQINKKFSGKLSFSDKSGTHFVLTTEGNVKYQLTGKIDGLKKFVNKKVVILGYIAPTVLTMNSSRMPSSIRQTIVVLECYPYIETNTHQPKSSDKH